MKAGQQMDIEDDLAMHPASSPAIELSRVAFWYWRAVKTVRLKDSPPLVKQAMLAEVDRRFQRARRQLKPTSRWS